MWEKLLALGGFGLSLVGHNRAKKASEKMEMHYYKEAALNRQIGAFNTQVAVMSGERDLKAVAQKTRATVSAQKAEFARRGMAIEGSAAYVIQETLDEGLREATEVALNTRIAVMGTELAAERSEGQAVAGAMSAKASGQQSEVDIFKTFIKGIKDVPKSTPGSGEGTGSLMSKIFGGA